ncbi:hypothetical protein FK220_013810 [Flavobacteriaceae bacterium TP-CH-4]|uniref:STAS/SEC14 domain-containing protein n=1 Tax=Pelagihabitans pacificus TaxID=2696054 RepID=A0A967AW20_9FLAO|nr:hypothetical protein [Pelagihabitans pacificus]NHF60425.1 hypothetical protein [Pelagihabitans pacificus]
MDSKADKKLIKKHDLEIGSFYFYPNFMISEVKEGVAVGFENAQEMLALAKNYYGNTTPFVYITNRINSYSFNPTVHFKTTAMFPNLKGYAVVTYDPMNHDIAQMEQSFMNKPAKNFHSLEKAIEWAESLIVKD